jgi:hypothetical protein
MQRPVTRIIGVEDDRDAPLGGTRTVRTAPDSGWPSISTTGMDAVQVHRAHHGLVDEHQCSPAAIGSGGVSSVHTTLLIDQM